MLGAICDKLDCAGAVACQRLHRASVDCLYALLCDIPDLWGHLLRRSRRRNATCSAARTRKSGEGMKGFPIGPVWVAIVWGVSIAILWAVLTVQPVQFDRHSSHPWLFPAPIEAARPLPSDAFKAKPARLGEHDCALGKT